MALVTAITNERDAMIDTSGTPDTDVVQDQVPDIGFSVHELQYLLSIAPGEIADKSAQVFNVGPVPAVDETILIGGAALLARGQLEFREGGEFQPVDAALIVAYMLTNATRWTTITGATEDAADLGVYVESPSGGVLAQPRTLGTWWFVLLDPDSVPGEIVIASVLGMAEQGATTGVVAQSVTLEHDRTFNVRRDAGAWGFAYGTTGASEPEFVAETATMDELVVELASFVAHYPEMK